jgi:hypothetical protein
MEMSGVPAIVSIDTKVEGSGCEGSRTGMAAVTGMPKFGPGGEWI